MPKCSARSGGARTRSEGGALYAVIETLPEGYTGEIVAGQLHVHPRPAARHIRLAFRLGSKLETPFGEGEGDWRDAGVARGDERVCLPPFEAVSFRLPWS